MQWFKHDANANMDAKLQEVLLDYGLEGYGLYWYCIELIAGKIDKNNITFALEHDARIIARNTGCTVQKTQEMMKKFIDLGLFESSDGIVTCMKLARRLDQSMTSNPEMRAIISEIKNHDTIMTASSNCLTESCKNRIDKIRIEENIKDCNQEEKKEQIHYEKIKDAYNEILGDKLGKCRDLTAQRKKHIKARINDDKKRLDPEWWSNYFKAVLQMDFLIGNSAPNPATGKVWLASLDWLINENNMVKVLEGKYA